MNEIEAALLKSNHRLRRAVAAIRDGHKACMTFLLAEGLGADHSPASLVDSILLAEAVAKCALAIGSGPEEDGLCALLVVALKYGEHQQNCNDWGNADYPYGEERGCDCGWEAVRGRLSSLVGGE